MRTNKPLLHGEITASIIDSFFDVHKESAVLPRILRKSIQAKKQEVPVVAVVPPFWATVQSPFLRQAVAMTAISGEVDQQPHIPESLKNLFSLAAQWDPKVGPTRIGSAIATRIAVDGAVDHDARNDGCSAHERAGPKAIDLSCLELDQLRS